MKTFVTFILTAFLFTGCEKMILGPEADNSPRSNFEILWRTFDENYPLFTVKHLNWDSLHSVYAAKITDQMTESELWNVATGLLQSLDDGHVLLTHKGYANGFCPAKISLRKMDDFSLDLVKNKYLASYSVAGGGYIVYGRIKTTLTSTRIGYVCIVTFKGSQSDGSPDWAYDMYRVVDELADCDGLIVDVRNNGGGLRATLNILAPAFIDRAITYFYQRSKTGPGHDQFGDPMPLLVAPRPGVKPFAKKIALLTNRFSGSGSEHFTQVFRFLPYATQIGDTTFGAFGDVVNTAELPNGWTYYYPCRLTITSDGECFEGLGMVPDVLVENTAMDINAGRDNVMNRAISFLTTP